MFALTLAVCALAIPAKPGAFDYVQPDGSVVRLEMHGDEFFAWTTLAGSSQVMELGEDGFWRPSTLDYPALKAAGARRAMMNRSRIEPFTHTDNPMTHGERHIPVFLVSFKDKDFSIADPAEAFNRMLNQNGYSENDARGSVQDFYLDNSHGEFKPVFDIYGPVKLPQNMAYYGGNTNKNPGSDRQPYMALYHAAQQLKDQIDWTLYDTDNDGILDMLLFYYAGYSEAEGQGINQDCIWPHQWDMRVAGGAVGSATYDGKLLGKYFCTSELKNNSGSTMCSIGPTCHEFAHSLGLPDFYDSDGEVNGEAGGLYFYSTMCYGSYNMDSTCPPYFNSEERLLLGWMTEDDIQTLTPGMCTIGNIRDDIAYRSYTSTDGEYFVYECREQSGWDAYLPGGLIVYHVDKSPSRHLVDAATGADYTLDILWSDWRSSNKVNAFGNHPCFYIVPSADQSNLLMTFYYYADIQKLPFPGKDKVTTYTPIDWNGNQTGTRISGIGYASGNVSMFVESFEPATSFAQLGINAIADPKNGAYSSGDKFTFEASLADDPVSVVWYYDGAKVSASSVNLTAGSHVVNALLTFADGATEILSLSLSVK